ncbi:hypothetical protein [Vibrio coralliilyticus]|uniref:hypothetical protein n=1 Tax=Vibrio coralliilyticus TaxID=190893 RepID=UPI001E4A1D13|nr:hypothetical protein [Vibrio coralliilyticus]MCC2525550.1 hypothetical protein [Vibrio coralliilyticus]
MKKYRCYRTSVEDFLTAPQQAGIAPERYFSMLNDAFIKDNGVEYSFSIDHDINLMELAFVNSGRNYVFIDNEDAEYLYRMKFSGTMMDSLPLHRSVFAISPTTNLQIDGVPILPIMVCDYESRTESTKQIADAFNQPVLGAPVNEEQLLFTIVIPDSMAKHNQKLTLGVSGAQLKEIAGTNDPDTFTMLLATTERP